MMNGWIMTNKVKFVSSSTSQTGIDGVILESPESIGAGKPDTRKATKIENVCGAATTEER